MANLTNICARLQIYNTFTIYNIMHISVCVCAYIYYMKLSLNYKLTKVEVEAFVKDHRTEYRVQLCRK